jgi:hypothetical protein
VEPLSSLTTVKAPLNPLIGLSIYMATEYGKSLTTGAAPPVVFCDVVLLKSFAVKMEPFSMGTVLLC